MYGTILIQASFSSAKRHVPTIRRYLEIDHEHNSAQDIVNPDPPIYMNVQILPGLFGYYLNTRVCSGSV